MTNDMSAIEDLSTDSLAAALRAKAQGYYPEEAAAELLIAAKSADWLSRRDFRHQYMSYNPDGWAGDEETAPMASVRWDEIQKDLDTNKFVVCSSSALEIVLLAGGLAGKLSINLRDAMSSLDTTNTRHFLNAVARRKGWHEHGIAATVTGQFGYPMAEHAHGS